MNALFKYCAVCQKENLASASFCEQCDADLLNVPAAPRAQAPDPVVERIAGPAQQRPATVAPIIRGPNQEAIATRHAADYKPSLSLELVENPALRFQIRADQSVGRASKADVVLNGVPNLDFISRAHARFLHRRGQWYVQYIAEGNFIKVDGTEYTDDSEVAIYEDSVVVLSLTAFRVKLD